MKLIIDIDVSPEEFKKIQVFNIKMMNSKITHKVYEAVQNGIPVPQGEWIRTGQKNVYGGVVIKCSHCGTTLITSPERYEFAENYCDMCGAKMEKNNEK